MVEPLVVTTWETASGDVLATELALPRVVVLEEVGSTMDVAGELAASGAPAGTLVLADVQTAGRGRGGRRWESRAGEGLWMTLVERINDPVALEVLSLRVGIRAAQALDRFSPAPVGLKWPNDLYLDGRKLGGILVETRWRGSLPEWTAVGVGINVGAVRHPACAALGAGVSRREVLSELVPALRAAAHARGALSDRDAAAFAARDVAAGRLCREPVAGRVLGIATDGSLLVRTASGDVHVREGSLVLEET